MKSFLKRDFYQRHIVDHLAFTLFSIDNPDQKFRFALVSFRIGILPKTFKTQLLSKAE